MRHYTRQMADIQREEMMYQVRKIKVDENSHEQRLDNFLIKCCKNVPKSRLYRAIRSGEVRVDGKRCKAFQKLLSGQEVRVPPLRQPEEKPVAPLQFSLEDAIIVENKDWLAINKPSGIAVHGGSGLSSGLIESLRMLYPKQYFELVHRLDRETSGCLLVAKKASILKRLHEKLRNKEMKKTYVALLAGEIQWETQTLRAALLKNQLQSGERMVHVDEAGKESCTKFRVIKRIEGATWVEAQPTTGRTHQIRVHAQHLGHPVIGDQKYGSKTINQYYRKLGLGRLCLHAKSLEFSDDQGKINKITSELPSDWIKLLENHSD